MTRVRFDPGFLDDPRWDRLGADAYILHTKACAYVAHTLSDGFVPAARALTLTTLVRKPKQAVDLLVSDELWQRVDGGYRVCDCHDDLRRSDGRGDEQPSRGYVESERKRKRENAQKYRERNRDTSSVSSRERNRDTSSVASDTQHSAVRHSAVRHSAVQEPQVPVPAPALADDDTVCEHGTPNGKLLTTAGDPRCPMCRRLSIVQDSA